MTEESSLERTFRYYWLALSEDLPEPEVQAQRLIPKRRFVCDLAWRKEKLVVELEGGSWSGGRHTSGVGYAKDCEKYNLLTLAGYRILRYTTDMVQNKPHEMIAQIRQALTSK